MNHASPLCLLLALLAFLRFEGDQPKATIVKIPSDALEVVVKVTPKVISGSLPEDAKAFQALKDMGIKTIVSVDGMKPNAELAAQYGLRYVHLPHGYDTVPEARVKELARAFRDLDGPIYVHCHHGKHRSPAAVAAGCLALGLLSRDEARQVLKVSGTSPHYQGLFDVVEKTQKLSKSELDRVVVDFKSSAPVPPLAAAMVEIEHVFGNLRKFSRNDWKSLAAHPALDAAHETLLLREHYAELLRAKEIRTRPKAFIELLRDGEKHATELETALRIWDNEMRRGPTPAVIGHSFAALARGCTTCHAKFRD